MSTMSRAGTTGVHAPTAACGVESADFHDRVRAAHRCYPTGVTIVTTCLDGTPYGLAVNAFSSVSMDPPRVLVCVKTSSQTHEHLVAGTHLGINFLSHGQYDIASVFATSGGDKFAQLGWRAGIHGVPFIDGASAGLEVEIEQRLPATTHTIFIGRVVNAEVSGTAPLIYHDGAFFDGSRLHPA